MTMVFARGWGGTYWNENPVQIAAITERFDAPNDAATLCCEAGAIAEAHKVGLAVAASVYVSREGPDALFVILTPCGICQERLAHWGGDVQMGVPDPVDPSRWLSLSLREVQPHGWRRAFEAF